MSGLLKYEVPTATQNIGDNYIEDFEMMQTPELQSYADGKDYQSLDFIDADSGSIKYEQLGDVDNLIALEDDNFYGADAYDDFDGEYGANGRRTRRRRPSSRSSRGSRSRTGRRSSGRARSFFGSIGDGIRRRSEARQQRRLERIKGRNARKLTEEKAKIAQARAMGKGAQAELEIAKTLGATAQAQEKKGLSRGAIIGITIGALAVIGVIAYFVIKKKKAGALATPVLKPAV
jgi:hypothetical protein